MRGKYLVCEHGHMMLTVSWSQLRAFEECRQKVALLKKGKRQHAADARVFFPGTVVDRVVRDYLANENREPGAMPDMVHDIMIREERLLREDENRVVRWRDPADKKSVEEKCIEAVRRIEPALVKYVLPYRFQVDRRFRIPMQVPYRGQMVTIVLIGAMDISVHNDEAGWSALFDVKMTEDEQYWKKTQGQMTFYDIAEELENGKPPRATALLQPMCKKQVRVIPVDQDRRRQMLSHIATFTQAFLDNDLPYTKKATQCTYCDFKHACPKFKTVVNSSGKKTLSF